VKGAWAIGVSLGGGTMWERIWGQSRVNERFFSLPQGLIGGGKGTQKKSTERFDGGVKKRGKELIVRVNASTETRSKGVLGKRRGQGGLQKSGTFTKIFLRCGQ